MLFEMRRIELDAAAGVERFTALHVAAQRGNAFAVQVILQTHCDNMKFGEHMAGVLNARDMLGRTPLHYAAWNNRVAVVDQLTKDESLEVNAADMDGYTALHLASRKGHDKIVTLLLSNKNIDPNAAETKGGEESRSFAEGELIWEEFGLPKLEYPWFNESRRKVAPLHYAVEKGHPEVVKNLLSHPSIDVYLENSDHKSAFDAAIRHRRDTVLKALVERTNADIVTMGKLIKVVTRSANEEVSWDIVAFLRDDVTSIIREFYPQIVETSTRQGVTLLHEIAFTGLHKWMEDLVLWPNMDINAGDNYQQTPLHYATLRGNTEVVEVLTSQPALRANEEDKTGRPALQIAIERKWKNIEKLLLERPDVKDYVDRLYRDRQLHVDAANAILVGAALIAGVTFAGWLQPPLGYTPYYEFLVPDSVAPPGTFESYAAVKQHISIRAFWVCNSLSFFLAIGTVIAGAVAVLPTQDVFIKEEVRMVRRSLIVTAVLIVFAVVFVLGAFGAAGFASLPPIMSLDVNMIVTCCLGVGICVALLFWFLIRLYKIRPSWLGPPRKESNKDRSLDYI